MRIGRNGEKKADMPEDPTWDRWREWQQKKSKNDAKITIRYGLEYR
jgi:hypothetical protein